MLLKKIKKEFDNVIAVAAAVAKSVVMSRPVERREKPASRGEIIIMGNGPSLRTTLDSRRDWLEGKPLAAVNFAANTPEFTSLRPEMYVIVDPHFFHGEGHDPNVGRLWDNLRKVEWRMTLYVARAERENARRRRLPGCVTVKSLNLTPADGVDGVTYRLFDLGIAMPRPRNVMVAAIMAAIREGYSKIWLVGADHSWTKTLWIDDRNRIITVQPHFYEDSAGELDRVAEAYRDVSLDQLLGSWAMAFRSYRQLARYASRRGVEIVNATPGSFIDAFPRG